MSCSDVWGRVYNIGSAEEITIEELSDKIIELTASKSEKKFISYQEAYGKPFDDMVRRVPCLKRINETIGYEPKTNFEQTLRYVIDDVKKRLGM